MRPLEFGATSLQSVKVQNIQHFLTTKIQMVFTAAIETGQCVNGCLVTCNPIYDELKQITFMHQDKFVQTYYIGII